MARNDTQTPRTSHRALKAGVATAAVVALLAGGGTFARWYDTAGADGGSVESGQLRFDTVGTGTWTDQATGSVITTGTGDNDAASGPQYFDIVPGDTIVYEVPFTIQAHGDNLQAQLAVDAETLVGTGALADYVDISTSIDSAADAPVMDITEADDGSEHTAYVTVAYPFDAANPTTNGQDLSLDLTGMELTLNQIDHTA